MEIGIYMMEMELSQVLMECGKYLFLNINRHFPINKDTQEVYNAVEYLFGSVKMTAELSY